MINCAELNPRMVGGPKCILEVAHADQHYNGVEYWDDERHQPETINHPSHYGGDTTYEAIKVIEAWGLDKNFCLGNVLKYLSRLDKKLGEDSIEALKKAKFYLDREIQKREQRDTAAAAK